MTRTKLANIQRVAEHNLYDFRTASFPTSGNIFFVSSAASAGGNGLSPESAVTTIDAAINLCTAANGDIIYVMEGHAETLIAAAAIAADVSGISIIGLGRGRLRPVVTYGTSTAASLDVSAANVTIKNIILNPTGIDAIVAAINVTAADFWMDDCEWDICNAAADKQMVLGILTAATATRFKVTNTVFRGPATVTGTTCTACIKHEVGVDFDISNCDFHGKMTQAILNATTVLGGKIHNNRFQIYTGTKGIALAAATTALITNNRFNVPSGTAPIVAAAGFVAGNAYSAAAGVTAGTASTF